VALWLGFLPSGAYLRRFCPLLWPIVFHKTWFGPRWHHHWRCQLLDPSCGYSHDVRLSSMLTSQVLNAPRITFVEARDVFNSYGYDASVGAYAFGFTWAAAVCLAIATTLFFSGCFVGHSTYDAVRRRSFFRRNRRPRGSFVENGRVKEEY
jgi:hypothetical protein